jgi:RimJ/RimL family protein N-acetyltransferase
MCSIKVNENTSLSQTTINDCNAMVEYLNEKEIFDATLNIPYPYTMKDAKYIVGYFKNLKLKSAYLTNWAIRNIEGKLIGVVGFHNGIKSHKAEIGYWLAKPYWGKGIMTEVVQKVCDIAFQKFKLLRITAIVFENNIASAKVLEKCNFVLEGACLKNYYQKEGKAVNAKLFALTK